MKVHEILRTWSRRARWRREIRTLDPRIAHDIGLCRDQLQLEAEKPFWRR